MKKILSLLALSFALVSCGTAEPLDVINPDSDYLYFYGKTCPHCIEVNAYMKENDTLNNYSIEKREIYGNIKNQQMFQAVTQALNIPEGTAGVPFVLNKKTNEYVIGTDPVKELFPATPVAANTETDTSSEQATEEVEVETETELESQEAPSGETDFAEPESTQ